METAYITYNSKGLTLRNEGLRGCEWYWAGQLERLQTPSWRVYSNLANVTVKSQDSYYPAPQFHARVFLRVFSRVRARSCPYPLLKRSNLAASIHYSLGFQYYAWSYMVMAYGITASGEIVAKAYIDYQIRSISCATCVTSSRKFTRGYVHGRVRKTSPGREFA